MLEAALEVFCRLGYRKASMGDVAAEAGISRQGLYFLFESKARLFAAATAHGVRRDLAAATAALAARAPLTQRLLAAFEAWSGRYVGRTGAELSTLAAGHPELVDDHVRDAPGLFFDLVVEAVARARSRWDDGRVDDVVRTLVHTSVGAKHHAASRDDYRQAMRTAIDLLAR